MSPVQEEEGPNAVSQLARKVRELCQPQHLIHKKKYMYTWKIYKDLPHVRNGRKTIKDLWDGTIVRLTLRNSPQCLPVMTFDPVRVCVLLSRCRAQGPKAGTGSRLCLTEMMNTSFSRRPRVRQSLTSEWECLSSGSEVTTVSSFRDLSQYGRLLRSGSLYVHINVINSDFMSLKTYFFPFHAYRSL